jgi:osmotically inducible lipoprotein OsmB
MQKQLALGGLLTLAVVLTACGTTRTERGLSGGAIGAGLGAAAGKVIGDKPGRGALIGGAAGAATGVLTTDDRDGVRHRERSHQADDCYYDRTRRAYYCRR